MDRMIPVFNPGMEWYVREIESGIPFSLVRYGEGDLRTTCPYLPHKGAVKFWRRYPQAREEYTQSVVSMPRHDRYWPAIWHQGNLVKRKWMSTYRKWLDEAGLGDVKWHHGRVWSRMIDADLTYVLIEAIKSQPLPVVIVGPDYLSPAVERLGAAHIITPFSGSPVPGTLGDTYPGIALEAIYLGMPRIGREVLAFSPAMFIFSASFVGKILISQLFYEIGEESTMIDFGASWDGLCRHPSRPGQRKFSDEKIRVNWEGP